MVIGMCAALFELVDVYMCLVEEKVEEFFFFVRVAVGEHVEVIHVDEWFGGGLGCWRFGCICTLGRGVGVSGVAFDHVDEFFGLYGFAEVIIHAGLEAFVTVADHGVGGEGNDWQVGAGRLFKGAQLCGGLIAVEYGHLAVHEDDTVGACGDHVEGFAAIGGEVDIVKAEFGEKLHNEFLVDRVIIDGENFYVGWELYVGVFAFRVVEVYGFGAVFCDIKGEVEGEG